MPLIEKFVCVCVYVRVHITSIVAQTPIMKWSGDLFVLCVCVGGMISASHIYKYMRVCERVFVFIDFVGCVTGGGFVCSLSGRIEAYLFNGKIDCVVCP